jgi:hypothetical protein
MRAGKRTDQAAKTLNDHDHDHEPGLDRTNGHTNTHEVYTFEHIAFAILTAIMPTLAVCVTIGYWGAVRGSGTFHWDQVWLTCASLSASFCVCACSDNTCAEAVIAWYV